MKTLWQAETRAECMARARQLTPESQRRWGKMTVDQMLAHVVDAFRMGLGELEVRPRKLVVRFWPINYVICNWVPFPQNLPTASEIVSRKKASIDEELQQLEAALIRFAAKRNQRVWPLHPAFGKLSASSWGRLGYKHVDHHLRQFGV
jgi:hypothetical protein